MKQQPKEAAGSSHAENTLDTVWLFNHSALTDVMWHWKLVPDADAGGPDNPVATSVRRSGC